MSGELILENRGLGRILPVLLLSGAGAAVVSGVLLSLVHLQGGALAVTAALVAYVLFRVLYPAVGGMLPGGGTQTVIWRMTGTDLILGEKTIPLRSIKMVHCWPARDALGHQSAGWTVNIETTGKNEVLHSLREGEGAESSALRLRAMVMALGYEDNWPL